MTGLTFGIDTVIDLASDEPIGLDGYVFEASSAEDGADWGNPDAVITEIQSQLLDGSLGKITSFGNRIATIPLRIYAIDMDTLAAAEAVLMSEVYRDGWNQLVWTPPAASVSTVFDVVYADLQFKLDDLDEHRCIRNYTLTLTCLPRPRSAELVSVESLPVPTPTPATTTISDGSSATGWSTTGRVETRRNLIPNPSFTYGTAGWVPGAGTTTFTREASSPSVPTGPYLYFAGANPSYVNGASVPVTAGTTYYVGLSSASFGSLAGVLVRFFNSAGSQIGSDSDHALTFGSTWGAASFSVAAPTGATAMAIYPHANFGASMDSVYVSTVNAYLDGDGANCAWVGAPGNSPSVLLTAASVTSSGGMVTAGKTFGTSATLTLTQSIDASVQTYVAVTGNLTFQEGGTPSTMDFSLSAGGKTLRPSSLQYDGAGGAFTAYFNVAASVTGITLTATGSGVSGGFTTLKVDSVITSDSLPVLGSPRQQYRQLSVAGSARTQASLRIETSEAALGSQTLAFSAPPQSSGFQPPLRSHRVGGPVSTDSDTAVSGATNTLATSQASADHWSISTTVLQPATYELYAYLSVDSATTVTLSWQASGTAAGVPTVTDSRTVTLQPGYQFVSVGSIELPTARAYAGSSDDVQLWLWASATGVTIDDAYLFSGDGHLSIIGTAGCSLLLLNSASIDDPEATAWVGKAAGSSGGDPDVDTSVVYAGNRAQAWKQHQFAPPVTNVFVVTPGTTQAQVSMTYYPRWGHHAAWVPAA